jgi:hypothetical protein
MPTKRTTQLSIVNAGVGEVSSKQLNPARDCAVRKNETQPTLKARQPLASSTEPVNFGAINRCRAADKTSRVENRIIIEANKPDQAAISSVIREWIVPLLVKQFLEERSAKSPSTAAANRQKLDTGPLGKEQRVV